LRDQRNADGFTRDRLLYLLADDARNLTTAARRRDPVEALFHLLEQPLAHRDVLARPLERLALAYLTQVRQNGKLCDSVATFHLSNGARLERINTFGNLRPYGLQASFGVTANYRYLPAELEENHERFVRGEIRVANSLVSDYKAVAKAWQQQVPLQSGNH
jgi:malonyl-CoA decarboxylase